MEKVSILCTALCVGLLVGGCSVRNEYNPSADMLPKTLLEGLEYKPDGVVSELVYDGTEFICYRKTEVDYIYNVKAKYISIGGTKYEYVGFSTIVNIGENIDNNKSEKSYIVGNFSSRDLGYNSTYRVQAMVDLDTGDVTVVEPREYLDYFVSGKEYSGDNDFYFCATARYSALCANDGGAYKLGEDGGMFLHTDYGVGTFSLDNIDFVAKIDPVGNITVVTKTFLDYFKHGEVYNYYLYNMDDKALLMYNVVYTYQNNGDMATRTGTFSNGEITLKATIDKDGNITVEIVE